MDGGDDRRSAATPTDTIGVGAIGSSSSAAGGTDEGAGGVLPRSPAVIDTMTSGEDSERGGRWEGGAATGMNGGTVDGGLTAAGTLSRVGFTIARARARRAGSTWGVFREVVRVRERPLPIARALPRFGREKPELRECIHRHRQSRGALRELTRVFALEKERDPRPQVRRPGLSSAEPLERVDLLECLGRVAVGELELERPEIRIDERSLLGALADRECSLDRLERRSRRLEDSPRQPRADILEEVCPRRPPFAHGAAHLAIRERADRFRHRAHRRERHAAVASLAGTPARGVLRGREVNGVVGRHLREEGYEVELLQRARRPIDARVARECRNVEPRSFVLARGGVPDAAFKELRRGEKRRDAPYFGPHRVRGRERAELAGDRLGESPGHPFHLQPFARELGRRAVAVLADRPRLVVRAELDLVRFEQCILGVEGAPIGAGDDPTSDFERARRQSVPRERAASTGGAGAAAGTRAPRTRFSIRILLRPAASTSRPRFPLFPPSRRLIA